MKKKQRQKKNKYKKNKENNRSFRKRSNASGALVIKKKNLKLWAKIQENKKKMQTCCSWHVCPEQ